MRDVIFNNELQKIGDRLFSFCRSLESITLPSTVTEIGISAFNCCSNLKEVTFNDGLQKIGTSAFYDSKSLESIILPTTLVEIGECAFYYCSNLREVIFNDGDCRRLGLKHFTTVHHWNVSHYHLLLLGLVLMHLVDAEI